MINITRCKLSFICSMTRKTMVLHYLGGYGSPIIQSTVKICMLLFFLKIICILLHHSKFCYLFDHAVCKRYCY
ncbi:hypothetical protein Hdeb2414_s0007g00248381 [Helianthus debilis subsp. tardiflorus]